MQSKQMELPRSPDQIREQTNSRAHNECRNMNNQRCDNTDHRLEPNSMNLLQKRLFTASDIMREPFNTQAGKEFLNKIVQSLPNFKGYNNLAQIMSSANGSKEFMQAINSTLGNMSVRDKQALFDKMSRNIRA